MNWCGSPSRLSVIPFRHGLISKPCVSSSKASFDTVYPLNLSQPSSRYVPPTEPPSPIFPLSSSLSLLTFILKAFLGAADEYSQIGNRQRRYGKRWINHMPISEEIYSSAKTRDFRLTNRLHCRVWGREMIIPLMLFLVWSGDRVVNILPLRHNFYSP